MSDETTSNLPDPPRCNTCPFWVSPGAPHGECHRFPPATTREDTGWGEDETETIDLGIFPETLHDDFCGEHPSFKGYLDGLSRGDEP